jgi:hypothetical protein
MTYIPTLDQFDEAQRAGNDAAETEDTNAAQYQAYRDAYNAKMKQFAIESDRARVEAQRERNATAAPVEGRFVNPAVTLDDIELTKRIWRETEAEAY